MPWSPGTYIGSYEILGLLGAGGMGEVYRGRDARLQRDAALKILPGSLLQDPDRRARFEREARVLASLNHPNIAAIYGIEDADGPNGRTPVLILELVEGRSLAERIAAGPLPADEPIAMARQIADALEAAHDRGIIHRDLKPANVQITSEGLVKVLDFGLAKALDAAAPAFDSDTNSPTLTSGPARLGSGGVASTDIGVVMGTAAYMAPEQARGKAVDRRADIWAFGALLFELLTGTRAFPGETVSDTIAAVLTGTPDWTALPPSTPAAVRQLLQRCLERDPRQRLQAIGEARIVLSGPLHNAPALAVPGRRLSLAAAAGLALAAASLVGTGAWWVTRGSVAAPSVPRKLDFAVDGLLSGLSRAPVLSPDARHIAYVADGRLWIRSLEDFVPHEVENSSEALYPFWSPDGTQLAFVREGKLLRVAAAGGAPQLVGNVPPDMTGSGAGVWTVEGNFLLAGSDTTGITELAGRDGSQREILPLDRSAESDFHEISPLPDGRGYLVTAHTSQAAETIFALVEGKRRPVLTIAGENLRSPVYHPSGYLFFARETIRRGLWAVRFSLESLSTIGDPFMVDPSGRAPSIARDGTIMFVRGTERPSELIWIDRNGGTATAGMLNGQVPEHIDLPTMRLSPDGQRVVLGLEDNIWVYDFRRGSMSPLSRGIQRAIAPVWLPDGSRIIFTGFVGTRTWSIHSVPSTEIATPQRVLAESNEFEWPVDVTPDGRFLLFARTFSTSNDLWIAPLDRPADAKRLLETPAAEREGRISPDGKWLAYSSDETGRPELYLRRFPIGSDRELISSGGASSINWAADSHELFYRTGNAIMAVQVGERDGRLNASVPVRLFETPDAAISRMFVVAPDGKRFLFARATGADRISVMLNWTPPATDSK